MIPSAYPDDPFVGRTERYGCYWRAPASEMCPAPPKKPCREKIWAVVNDAEAAASSNLKHGERSWADQSLTANRNELRSLRRCAAIFPIAIDAPRQREAALEILIRCLRVRGRASKSCSFHTGCMHGAYAISAICFSQRKTQPVACHSPPLSLFLFSRPMRQADSKLCGPAGAAAATAAAGL